MLLGIDIGTSSVKVSVLDTQTFQCIATAAYPDTEAKIVSLQQGWAEQSPDQWWEYTQVAIQRLHASGKYDPQAIEAIGIAYQMHGLVLVDAAQQCIRNSIIWCDSRAVPYGDAAFKALGEKYCLSTLLNSPGNFTASKLAWVKEHEPQVYKRIDKLMLPGDFIAMKLTGTITTTPAALSEGMFWNFKEHGISTVLMEYFGFDPAFIPEVKNVFDDHGRITAAAATALSLKPGIPVTYKAGDQSNNALSLHVMEPGEVAANAGTSGVIYGVTDALAADPLSRINSFAHVNHRSEQQRIGVLLCINGAGITSSWVRSMGAGQTSYADLNRSIEAIPASSDGLFFLPFGNGAERMLNNQMIGAELTGLDFNNHTAAHIYRAGLEGVAHAFRYGLEIMQENSIRPTVIRAGHANMFLSDVFAASFVNTTGIPVELYENDGSCGSALGAGIGVGAFTAGEASAYMKPVKRIEVTDAEQYNDYYQVWKQHLNNHINHQ
ncbi:MAG: carbohydrate kinase [Sediminibacterium magnilacihabitans]|jgi:xylulokinase|nr:carbohydrate kinase [Sediminibacterium magnilacihabitans]PQV60719.1 xylulokinase [Sediminibacterium magnilacihabitans]